MEINHFNSSVGSWLRGSGAESDIVISTRIRLARNLGTFPFPARATDRDREMLEELITRKIRSVGILDDGVYFDLTQAEELDRLLLVERHLISKEHASSEGNRSVSFGRGEVASIMVNEEDHLRIQVIRSGLDVHGCWAQCEAIEQKLGQVLEFAFDEQFGYLTSCPTNVGTGLRVSVMVHLPALVLTNQMEKVFEAVSKINLAVRGLYGEGTSALGDFYQISNQITLGRTELDLLRQMERIVPQILRYERSVRTTLLQHSLTSLEDKVWRALGALRSARSIGSEEAMGYLSSVRMGVNLGLIGDLPIGIINELVLLTQPAHLQKLEGQALDSSNRDIARASFIRTRLDQN